MQHNPIAPLASTQHHSHAATTSSCGNQATVGVSAGSLLRGKDAGQATGVLASVLAILPAQKGGPPSKQKALCPREPFRTGGRPPPQSTLLS